MEVLAPVNQRPVKDGAISIGIFRKSMRFLAGGVCVITVGGGDQRSGLTVTSFNTLSIDPASVVFCLNKQASAWPILKSRGVFGANILASRHLDVANHFAGMGGVKGNDRYKAGRWTVLKSGVPILEDATVGLDCEVEEMLDRHSHSIVVGRVVAALLTETDDALVYCDGKYRALRELQA